MLNVPGYHCDDAIRKSSVVAIILNDKSRPIFAATAIGERKLKNDNVAALH
jgi:hypothetical protein